MMQSWYLALDLGTEAINGILFHPAAGKLYPLTWPGVQEGDRTPHLPWAVFWRGEQQEQFVGHGAQGLARTNPEDGLLLEHFKPFLAIAIPYYEDQKNQWQPQLRWPGSQVLSLYWLQQGLQALLSTLAPHTPAFSVEAKGLPPEQLRQALGHLEGIIVSAPSDRNHAYEFNVREALLQLELVTKADQVYFLEDSIACYLGLISKLPPRQGETLMAHWGMGGTELMLVPEQEDVKQINHADLRCDRIAYGQRAVRQDVLCQLIYPQWLTQLNQSLGDLEQTMPTPGKLETERRHRAAWLWQSSPLGRSLLEAARLSELLLQQRETFTAHLGGQSWQLDRKELQRKVLGPWLQEFNQELNHFLSTHGLHSAAIAQVVVSGRHVPLVWPQLQPWLSQKFSLAQHHVPVVSPNFCPVVLGLALLPVFPQLLNGDRHQYQDFFICQEILNTLEGVTDFTLGELQQRLRYRGLNTQHRGPMVEAFLQNQWPSGLIPGQPFQGVVANNNPEYGALFDHALFTWRKESDRYSYHPHQGKLLQEYFAKLTARTKQQWQEPLNINLEQF